MDNLKKAEKIRIAASRLQCEIDKLAKLESIYKESKTMACTIENDRYSVSFRTDETIPISIIELQKTRVKTASNELDELINGNVNRIKELLNERIEK